MQADGVLRRAASAGADALIGVPYGSVSIASNQGLYLCAAPEDRPLLGY